MRVSIDGADNPERRSQDVARVMPENIALHEEENKRRASAGAENKEHARRRLSDSESAQSGLMSIATAIKSSITGWECFRCEWSYPGRQTGGSRFQE